MYHKELARSGHWLFSIRGLNIHGAIIGAAIIAWCTGRYGPFGDGLLNVAANCGWQVFALAIALTGAFWRVITSGYAALGTSGNAKKEAVAAELNTTGLYSIVRNPLYTGRIINFTGIAMLSGSWVFGGFVFLISVLVYERISMYEEQFLIDKFGDEHRKWAEKIPALLPRLTGWVKPKYKFWWRRAVRREYKKFFQLATATILVDFARRGFTLPENLTCYYVYGAIVVWRLGMAAAHYFGKAFDDIS
ncbi:MAG: isoprenylcysteine carboxylmethyltransferase family protein [Sphingorhabdus sp.]